MSLTYISFRARAPKGKKVQNLILGMYQMIMKECDNEKGVDYKGTL